MNWPAGSSSRLLLDYHRPCPEIDQVLNFMGTHINSIKPRGSEDIVCAATCMIFSTLWLLSYT